ncbi:hypothetical protein [Microcoleus sp. Pol12B4]|uniref:hypothetical protein n=1 Tax=Microcoleus sp. Pol12B4 TaxID=3055395 RepID=UPI002FD6E636
MDNRGVVEAVPPLSPKKKLDSAPEYILGLFNYAGHLLHAVEMCPPIQGTVARA